MTITLQISRDDGDVARFQGPAAIGLIMQSDAEIPEQGLAFSDMEGMKALLKGLEHMPVVSIRCDNLLQAVIMAGTLVGWVFQEGGHEALEAISLVASIAGFKDPDIKRMLP